MDIAVCGVARSGSTLAWQLLSTVIGSDIGQVHPGRDANLSSWRRFVVTVRHPFDVAASRYRVRLSRDIYGAGWIGLEAEIYVMLDHFAGAQRVVQNLDSVLLRYEDFFDDYDYAFDQYEKLLDHQISSTNRELAKIKYSLEENKKRQEALGCFLDLDPVTRLHGDHIGAVQPGSWREQLVDADLIELVEDLCADCAKEWGYEID